MIKASLTPKDYAELRKVKVDTVRAWCASGELRAIDVSLNRNSKKRRWRIPLDAIDEFEAGRTAKPEQKPAHRRRKKDPSIIEFFK